MLMRKFFRGRITPVLRYSRFLSTEQKVETNFGIPVHVKAYYIAQSIDLNMASQLPFNATKFNNQPKSVNITIDKAANRYLSIFSYGSVVFFNFTEAEQLEYLQMLRNISTLRVDESLQQSEAYKVLIYESLSQPSVLKAEHVNIRKLDVNNLTIISTVMAHTVSLDFYAVDIEKTTEAFLEMNRTIQISGSHRSLSATRLHKFIASNNIIFTHVLSKLGILEGSDAAWENAEYHKTWEELRKDFEIEARFKDLSQKLQLSNSDARFFLEVLHNHQSTKLEWIIIILIAGEMIVGLLGLAIQLG